jgi:hypothetical protein
MVAPPFDKLQEVNELLEYINTELKLKLEIDKPPNKSEQTEQNKIWEALRKNHKLYNSNSSDKNLRALFPVVNNDDSLEIIRQRSLDERSVWNINSEA